MISISVMMVLVHDVAREGNHDNIDIYWFTNQFNWSKKKKIYFLKILENKNVVWRSKTNPKY